jgi:hypothetical protein
VSGALAGAAPALWLTPNCGYPPVAEAVRQALADWGDRPPRLIDLGSALGECYGAAGVLQALAGCQWLADGGLGPVLATSGGVCGEDFSSVTLERPEGRCDE